MLSYGSAAAADHSASVRGQLPAQIGLHKPGATAKADTALARILEERRAHAAKGKGTAFKPSSKFVQVSANRILIDARASSDGDDLFDGLKKLGLINGSRYGDVVSGLLPFASIERALALQSVRSITASPRPITHAGSITSQGDVALRADIARSAYSVDGSGVTVGVVSDSYDTLGGAANDILSGDLPAGGVPVLNGESTLCGTLVFCIDEGRAMLQIIHDVAPGADLLFQTGIDGVAAYANAIANLAATGADIIVDDLLIINEPMFQDGVVAQAVDAAVAGGVAYFTAAGNSGRQSYEAAFDDSGEIFCIEFFEPYDDCDPTFERVGRMHDFDPGPGVDNYMHVTVPVNGVMTVALQWDQPFGGAGPTTDHDIVLLDETGQIYRDISANDNVITGEGWEAIRLDNNEVLDYGSEFSLMITYDDVDSVGPPATLVKLVIFGEGITVNEWATNSGTLFGHANATHAEAVGAAFYMDTPENGTSPPVLRPFSSAGGTPILFDTNGVRLTEPEIRQAPEIVAVDGVNTTFFFDDSIGNDGIDDFVGTSAAAPHAAGVAALVLEAKPTALPAQINGALQNSAIDMGAAGIDFDSGHGLIQADAAIAAVLAPYAKDMGGDGPADILWVNAATDQVHYWKMDGATITDSQQIAVLNDPDWTAVSQGDNNGDGMADILWLNSSTGQIYYWQMSGAPISSSSQVSILSDLDWQVVGEGDYNGDGYSDIMWRHAVTGQVYYWQMQGSTIVAAASVATVDDLDWQVVGDEDYNGDGYDDMMWRHTTTGEVYFWQMQASTITMSGQVAIPPDLAWQVVGNGDYNGDGKADLLWRHAVSGKVYYWQMDGSTIMLSARVTIEGDLNWKIVGDGDYDWDGMADILWRHALTGQIYYWKMNGYTTTSVASVATPADINWQIVNVN
jgi:hypothetical protein